MDFFHKFERHPLVEYSGTELLEQLDVWHDQNEYEKIIETLEAIPAEDRGYQFTGLLARAYSNAANGKARPEYQQRALELLQSEVDESDPNWQFRMGFALYWLNREAEAIPHLARIFALIPQEPDSLMYWDDARQLLEECRRIAGMQQEDGSLQYVEVYNEEEFAAVEDHITTWFGTYEYVMHELVSPDIHVDICVVSPTPERNYYTLVTMGMGAHRMDVPEGLAEYQLERAELAICLPPDWNLNSGDECDYWPIRWLKMLARLPIEEKSWLGWGHTIPNPGEGPFAENTDFSGMILLAPYLFAQEANVCVLPDGSEVNFYLMVPLYREEMDYKLQYDADALLELFANGKEPIPLLPLDLDRKNVCLENRKHFFIQPEAIAELLTDWDGVQGCLATDRIMVDGCAVGYCYREQPAEQHQEWDSGWRFTAGDESDGYMEDARHSGIYELNTICNYDSDILPLLSAPYGSAFARDEQGKFQPLEEQFLQDLMDDGDVHLECLQEKQLPVEELAAYNHLAIYLRWAMEQNLMHLWFMEAYGSVVTAVLQKNNDMDLRVFIRDELKGELLRIYFNQQGEAFSWYYYDGENESNPYYPADIDQHALAYFGEEAYYSQEFQDEAYLFVPYTEAYYQAMKQYLDARYQEWQTLCEDFNPVN